MSLFYKYVKAPLDKPMIKGKRYDFRFEVSNPYEQDDKAIEKLLEPFNQKIWKEYGVIGEVYNLVGRVDPAGDIIYFIKNSQGFTPRQIANGIINELRKYTKLVSFSFKDVKYWKFRWGVALVGIVGIGGVIALVKRRKK